MKANAVRCNQPRLHNQQDRPSRRDSCMNAHERGQRRTSEPRITKLEARVRAVPESRCHNEGVGYCNCREERSVSIASVNRWRVSKVGMHGSAQNLPGSHASRILETLNAG